MTVISSSKSFSDSKVPYFLFIRCTPLYDAAHTFRRDFSNKLKIKQKYPAIKRSGLLEIWELSKKNKGLKQVQDRSLEMAVTNRHHGSSMCSKSHLVTQHQHSVQNDLCQMT